MVCEVILPTSQMCPRSANEIAALLRYSQELYKSLIRVPKPHTFCGNRHRFVASRSRGFEKPCNNRTIIGKGQRAAAGLPG